jgi:excisionase family DNA binding protein
MITEIESETVELIGDRLLDCREVANVLAVSTRKVWKLNETGILRSVRIGGSVRWRASEVKRFLEEIGD